MVLPDYSRPGLDHRINFAMAKLEFRLVEESVRADYRFSAGGTWVMSRAPRWKVT